MLERAISIASTGQISTDETLSQKQGTLAKIRDKHLVRYLASDVNTKRADIVLVICGFVSGLVDGVSFTAWGSFASMQTGESACILYLAFSLNGLERKLGLYRSRRIWSTRIPSLPLGQITHLRRNVHRQQHLL